MLRRVRRLSRLSQRDLAAQAGVAVGVVARIESGGVRNPGIRTVETLVRAAGFGLDVVVERDGRRVAVADHPTEGARDLSGRRFPAHVEVVGVRGLWEDAPVMWWGWPYKWSTAPGARVPQHTYTTHTGRYHRPELDPVTGKPTRPGTMLDWDERQQALRAELALLQPHVLARSRTRPSNGDRVSRIGVFALQGDVREHLAALTAAGCAAVPVRRPTELAAVDGIVLPGGESTTMIKLARAFELLDPLRERIAAGLPVYGSCAGMILLADRVDTEGSPLAETIGGLDITVRRNAFGRQVDSFEDELDVAGLTEPVHAVFIRAPWVEAVGDGVEVLANSQDHPVAVRQGHLLATSFHPEVGADGRIHGLFLELVAGR